MSTFAAVDGETGEVIEFRGNELITAGRTTAVSLELPEAMSFEEWEAVGQSLQAVNRSVRWWVGDWLGYGSTRWGEMYTQAIQETGKAYDSLRTAKAVSERIGIDRRRSDLSWSHHAEVAFLQPELADSLLSKAAEAGWSQKELRTEVHRIRNDRANGFEPASDETCKVEDLHRLVELGQRYGTVYADPPWLYDNQMTRSATGNFYRGMTVDELCDLPVDKLAHPDAHLHLWTTNAFLFDCKRIMDAWGFEFRTTFVWVKPQMGIGNYWRNSHEFMLTGIRGNARRFRDHGLKSWLECDRGEHSGKPEQVRSYIQRASIGPYLELFARNPAEGWTVWGNQIRPNLLFPNLREVA